MFCLFWVLALPHTFYGQLDLWYRLHRICRSHWDYCHLILSFQIHNHFHSTSTFLWYTSFKIFCRFQSTDIPMFKCIFSILFFLMLLIFHSLGSYSGSYIAFSCLVLILFLGSRTCFSFVFHEIAIFVEFESVVYHNSPKWYFLLCSYCEI